MTNTKEVAVWASHITKTFGETTALKDVSIEVEQGELFGFIGPDGAGKTTLFRLLISLYTPDSGESRVLGLDPVNDLWALRRKIGYMPGRFSLYSDLSVAENLDFFASVFGTTVSAGMRTIEPIYRQLAPFASRRAGALSGGMKQKLALCCALVHEPEILFLDEPTTGVDAVSRREFWDLLARLRANGLTIVVSTPYMDEASRCDRIALIQNGKVLRTDTPDAICEAYPLPLFSVRGGDRLGMLEMLRSHPFAKSVWPFGTSIHFTDSRAQISQNDVAGIAGDLRNWLSVTYPDAQVSPIAAGIEDAFMLLMGDEDSSEDSSNSNESIPEQSNECLI